jgi:propanediol dehydratase large subunit
MKRKLLRNRKQTGRVQDVVQMMRIIEVGAAMDRAPAVEVRRLQGHVSSKRAEPVATATKKKAEPVAKAATSTAIREGMVRIKPSNLY